MSASTRRAGLFRWAAAALVLAAGGGSTVASRSAPLTTGGSNPPSAAESAGSTGGFGDVASPALTTSDFQKASDVRGEDALGTAYKPASITSTRVGPGRQDGVGSMRRFALFDNCSCFRYTSGKIPV